MNSDKGVPSAPSAARRDVSKKVILTGDDFGLAPPVNEAIIDANRRGTLTTASLMIGARFAKEAVEGARQCSALKVGLHLVLVEGNPVLPPERIPDLVDASGAFPEHPGRAGFRFFFHPRIRRQLEAEIRAQLEAFFRTGLALDHVNAHNHMHLHPTVLRLLLKVGRDYGLKAVRWPNEPPIRSWRVSKRSLASRCASWLFLSPWRALMKRRLRRASVSHNDFLFGNADSGAMTLERVLGFLRNLPDGVTELYFHPATRRCAEIDRTMPLYRHEDEYRALTSQALREALEAERIRRISFSEIG